MSRKKAGQIMAWTNYLQDKGRRETPRRFSLCEAVQYKIPRNSDPSDKVKPAYPPSKLTIR